MEYRAQTILGGMQVLVVFGGTLLVASALNGTESLQNEHAKILKGVPKATAKYGLLLLVVPLVWVYLMVRAERVQSRWSSKTFTVLSGIVLIVALSGPFIWAFMVTLSVFSPMSP